MRRWFFSSILIAALAVQASCGGTVGTDGESLLAETAAARTVVGILRARLQASTPARYAISSLPLGDGRRPGVDLPGSDASGLYVSRAQVRAHFAPAVLAHAAHAADVMLPLQAPNAMALQDGASGLGVTVQLRGLADVRAEAAGGYVVYRNAIAGGGHAVQRPTPTGTEDYLMLDAAPERPIVYDLTLGDGVAGLRLVGSTLELLDAGGAPRLRVAPPWLVGSDGVRVTARLTVDGCAVDTDARAPYGRAVTSIGSRRCAVTLGWDATRLRYPAVLDPSWTTTGDLIIGREAHTATPLPSGRVLIAGGASGDPVDLSEIFDPLSGTFAVAAPTASDHVAATATTILQSGRSVVLVAGGQSYDPALAEAYDEVSGSWILEGAMNTVRFAHTATVLPGGQVLVAGGLDLFGNLVTGSELFNPDSGTWTLAGYLNDPRQNHVAFIAPIAGVHTVVIAGGNSGAEVLAGAEAYDALQWRWTRLPDAALGTARTAAASLALPGGRVLVAGGASSASATPGSDLASAELFDPARATFAAAGRLASGRRFPLLVPLANGAVLAAGGSFADATGGNLSSAAADLYDATVGVWTTTTALGSARTNGAAALLADGSVLLVGGRSYVGGQIQILSAAERFRLGGNAAPCVAATECQSNVCSAGLCACAAGSNWCALSGTCIPVASCCGVCDLAVSASADAGVADAAISSTD